MSPTVPGGVGEHRSRGLAGTVDDSPPRRHDSDASRWVWPSDCIGNRMDADVRSSFRDSGVAAAFIVQTDGMLAADAHTTFRPMSLTA